MPKRYKPAWKLKNIIKDGKKFCAFCKKKETKTKYHKYCSDECQNEAYLQAGMNVRGNVRKRDKEICKKCGLDCALLKKIARESNIKYHYKPLNKYIGDERWEKIVVELNIPQHVIRSRVFWNADHIKEVRDGGITTMDNLQTLCWNCHYCKTHNKNKYNIITENTKFLFVTKG